MRLIDGLRRRYRKIAGYNRESRDSTADTNSSSSAESLDANASSSDIVKPLRAINITKDIEIASRVEWAGDSETRRRGLLGRDCIDPDEGMYIVPTQWIHMFGMRFPIDVAFLASDGRVLFIHHSLRPNRFSRPVWRAEGALELAAGTLESTGTAVGDIIELR